MNSKLPVLQELIPIAGPKLVTSPRIHVGFVVHVMQVAGAEMLIADTIRCLPNSIQPTIFCLDAIGALGQRLQLEGVPVICLQRRPGKDWRLPFRLARLLRQHNIHIVHAHQYTPFYYAALAKCLGRAKVKTILTEHGRHYPDIVSWKRRWGNRWVLSRYADEVNAVCQFSAKALQINDGFTSRPVTVIENGVHWDRYQTSPDKQALRNRLGLDAARQYVICVARFHPVKDHATLIEGFRQLADQHPTVDLLLAGDGSLRQSLEARCKELNIAHRVQFLGVRNDVSDLLQASDIFTLTSVSEAASLTLMEAMAAGLPSVVTNVGGNPEIIRQGVDGLLVERGAPHALAAALLSLLKDPQKARHWGESARQRARQSFSLDRTIQSYVGLYQKLGTKGS